MPSQWSQSRRTIGWVTGVTLAVTSHRLYRQGKIPAGHRNDHITDLIKDQARQPIDTG